MDAQGEGHSVDGSCLGSGACVREYRDWHCTTVEWRGVAYVLDRLKVWWDGGFGIKGE